MPCRGIELNNPLGALQIKHIHMYFDQINNKQLSANFEWKHLPNATREVTENCNQGAL